MGPTCRSTSEFLSFLSFFHSHHQLLQLVPFSFLATLSLILPLLHDNLHSNKKIKNEKQVHRPAHVGPPEERGRRRRPPRRCGAAQRRKPVREARARDGRVPVRDERGRQARYRVDPPRRDGSRDERGAREFFCVLFLVLFWPFSSLSRSHLPLVDALSLWGRERSFVAVSKKPKLTREKIIEKTPKSPKN